MTPSARSSVSSWWPRLRPWRWLLLPALVGASVAWLLYQIAIDYQLWGELNRWLWMPFWPVFGDLGETLLHFRQAAAGLDPLSDPTSTFAYPRFFLVLRWLHLQDLPTPVVGYGLALAWMAAVLFVLRPQRPLQAVAAAVVFVSPPVLLGLERGNVDLLLFIFLLGLAVFSSRAGPGKLPFAIFVVALACLSLMKLYPIFVLAAAAWIDRGWRRVAWIAVVAGIALHWYLGRAELVLVLSKFPFSLRYSWGCLVIFDFLRLYIPRNSWVLEEPWLKLLAMAAYGLVLAVALGLGFWWRKAFAAVKLSRPHWAHYWIGAALCCGSFLSTNFAYRWVFLLFVVPALWSVRRAGGSWPARWALATLVLVALTLAAPLDPKRKLFLAIQAIDWTLVLSLAAGWFAFTFSGETATMSRAQPAAAPPPAPGSV